MSTVTTSVPDVFAESFEGFPDELPVAVSNFCAGDRVVYADRWQGELDTPEPAFEPSAADSEWINENPPAEPFEPTAADWADYHDYCREMEARDELRRMEDAEYEARCRYAL
jgi:hypothetical protein